MRRSRILFLYEHEAPFVNQDLQILRQRFDVLAIECSRGVSTREIFRRVLDADATFSWFALGYTARAVLVGRLLRRPSVVVAGGWDVLSMPEIDYGAARGSRGSRRARYVLRKASVVLTFSSFSRQAITDLSGREAELVYLGVDTSRFKPRGKEPVVVSAGHITKQNLVRKGMETFVRSAALLPDVRFVLAGRLEPSASTALSAFLPHNLELPGYLGDDEFRELLGRARVYVQASYNEGFGLALAEAMASECVPVVTRNGSLPEVAGDTGFYVPYGDARATAEAIREALKTDGQAARARVEDKFPIERRRDRLLGLLEAILER